MAERLLHTIENDRLAVRISSCGAEMQSIAHVGEHAGLERLWCGDPAVWKRHAPLLFPLIGRLRDGYYELDDQRFDAPVHGFCRDRAFEVERLSKEAVRFTAQEDAETLEVYPFRFLLNVTYELDGATVVKTHRVENTGVISLPFELGGHEAYATLLKPGECMSDYYVRFAGLAGETSVEVYDMDEAGILRVPKRVIPLEDGCLTQTPEQLGLDTVILENVPGNSAELACLANDHVVRVDFPGFPYLGIWTACVGEEGQARYLCIEPWSALPDGHFAPRELAQKPGVRVVEPGESVELSYRMTFE